MIALLKELAGAYGPSGREEEIRNLIERKISSKVDQVYTDALGNLIAVKRGRKMGKESCLPPIWMK